MGRGIAELPADLAELQRVWLDLPADVRRTILHVARASVRPDASRG
jgi:hypothetical protein